MAREDAFSDFDALLAGYPLTDPWEHDHGEAPLYAPDYRLLGSLLAIPLAAKQVSESGRFARAIDAWTAHELRRAGFSPEEVWPRATRPRVLPRDVAVLLQKLPRKLSAEVASRLPDLAAVGPVDAKVLGRAYEKQVDVCIARWDRGPELLVSTKTQVSSFRNNLPNRFEEAYGDAGNLRGRYPLAAVGFLFVQRSTVLTQEPDAFERTVDMIRKLRDPGDGNGYTAAGLILVGWEDGAEGAVAVEVREHEVPEDVAAPQFFAAMVRQVLAASPITFHVAVRSQIERRHIPVREADTDPAADA
ncbi:MAG: hypothetical protein IT429_14525 [Gemmataceae bacterium]|nr:hypothetical protein [Gemmataceae bacterium]